MGLGFIFCCFCLVALFHPETLCVLIGMYSTFSLKVFIDTYLLPFYYSFVIVSRNFLDPFSVSLLVSSLHFKIPL